VGADPLLLHGGEGALDPQERGGNTTHCGRI
jgi:hypothetical protein